MNSEIHNLDAAREKSADPIASESQPVFKVVIRPNPFLPGAHMVEIKSPNPSTDSSDLKAAK